MKRVLVLNEDNETEAQANAFVLVYRDGLCEPNEKRFAQEGEKPCATRITSDLRGLSFLQAYSMLLSTLRVTEDIANELSKADGELKGVLRKAGMVLRGVNVALKECAGIRSEILPDFDD